MLELYKGIKIEDEVIIVEKQNDLHQGYLVNKNNKEQLETALNWAKETAIVKDKDGNQVVDYYYYYDHTKPGAPYTKTDTYQSGCYTHYKHENLDGIVHEYKNGEFKLSLTMSALGSSQGGKLSFWNCSILAPDGKEFLIGINSECLLSLLQNNTFVNGKCDKNIWLGRIKANVGAFTENMEEFEQGKKDKAIRTGAKTVKYESGAILIPSNRIFCDKYYKHFDVLSRAKKVNNYYFSQDTEYLVNIYTKPIPMYLYKDFPTVNWRTGEKLSLEESIEEFNTRTIDKYDFKPKKIPSVISEYSFGVDDSKLWANTCDYWNNCFKKTGPDTEYVYAFDRKALVTYQEVAKDNVVCPNKFDMLNLQYRKCELTQIEFLKDYFDRLKIPYTVDADEDQLRSEGY